MKYTDDTHEGSEGNVEKMKTSAVAVAMLCVHVYVATGIITSSVPLLT